MEFSNEKINKKIKKPELYVKINIGFYILAVCLIIFGYVRENNHRKEFKDFNKVINQTGEDAYATATNKIYKFAVYDDKTDAYYFINDGKYIYIAYLSESKADKITNLKDGETLKLYGKTTVITNEIKELALEAYNEGNEDEETLLTNESFENVFGKTVMNTLQVTSESSEYTTYALIIVIINSLILIDTFSSLKNNKKQMAKLTDNDMLKINAELQAANIICDDKVPVYLTENFIIGFEGSKISINNYQDIIWVYIFEQSVNGIKTTKSIKYQDIKGKFHNVAVMPYAKKNSNFDTIFETMVNKTTNAVHGYTTENMKIAKEKIVK